MERPNQQLNDREETDARANHGAADGVEGTAEKRPVLVEPAATRAADPESDARSRAVVPQQGGAGGAEHEASQPAATPADRFQSMRGDGKVWRALVGFEQLAGAVDAVPDPTAEEQAVWLGAVRQSIETAAETGLVDQAVATVGKLSEWFDKPHWRLWQQRTNAHFNQLIQVAVRMRRYQDALDLFAKARNPEVVDEETRLGLAMASAGLGRTDLAAAQLYLDFLESKSGDAAERSKILGLLRTAIRIDLVQPEERRLAAFLKLNERLWRSQVHPWCAAHRAIAAVRMSQLDDALTIRRAALDLDQADAETLVQLGTVSYLCRRWSDAASLFTRAEAKSGEEAGLERLYLPLTRINEILAGSEAAETRDQLLDRLQKQLAGAEAASREDAFALDAA